MSVRCSATTDTTRTSTRLDEVLAAGLLYKESLEIGSGLGGPVTYEQKIARDFIILKDGSRRGPKVAKKISYGKVGIFDKEDKTQKPIIGTVNYDSETKTYTGMITMRLAKGGRLQKLATPLTFKEGGPSKGLLGKSAAKKASDAYIKLLKGVGFGGTLHWVHWYDEDQARMSRPTAMA